MGMVILSWQSQYKVMWWLTDQHWRRFRQPGGSSQLSGKNALTKRGPHFLERHAFYLQH